MIGIKYGFDKILLDNIRITDLRMSLCLVINVLYLFISIVAYGESDGERIFSNSFNGNKIRLNINNNKAVVCDQFGLEYTQCDILQYNSEFIMINSSNRILESIKNDISIKYDFDESIKDGYVRFVFEDMNESSNQLLFEIICAENHIYPIGENSYVEIYKGNIDKKTTIRIYPAKYIESGIFGQYLKMAYYDISFCINNRDNVIHLVVNDIMRHFNQLFIKGDYIRIINENKIEWKGEYYENKEIY